MPSEFQAVIDPHDGGLVSGKTSATNVELQGPKDTLHNYGTHTQTVQERYDEAEEYAQEMIEKEPTASSGYLRLASLYRMQGKQQSAITVYEEGLQKVPEDDRGYAMMLQEKDVATKQSEKRVDFITKLPIEVVDETFALLPLSTKLSCLCVSRTWVTKILACKRTWCSLEITDPIAHEVMAKVIGFVAGHVENLVIRTKQNRILETITSIIHAGSFSKIKSLHLSSIMRNISASTMERLTNSFHQIHATLTSLVLCYSEDHISITLADLLVSLSNLRSLVYSTPAKPFSSIVGTFPLPKPHYALVDLDVNASSIIGEALIPILQNCPKVKRLVLSRCDNSVLDIVDTNCPNLKKLVYNIGGKYALPPRNEKAVQTPAGLQYFTVWQHQALKSVFDLMQRNTETLKVLDLNISKLSCEYLSVAPYQDMKLKRLEKITFQGHINDAIPQLILQWISNCTTLTDITASALYDVTDLVQVLVNRPRLISLSLNRLTTTTVAMNLARLFSSYAANSRKNEPAFRNISLQFCQVNRDVFCALSSIRTLRSITLSTLHPVSSLDLNYLFGFLSESTRDIHLDHMDSVTDQHLAMLGNLSGLRNIHLEFLRNLTDCGVMEMTNNASALHSLTIKYCGRDVTSKSIIHAKKKIRNVVYKSLYN